MSAANTPMADQYLEPRDIQPDTGHTEADRLIGRLTSADPDHDDCADSAQLLRQFASMAQDDDVLQALDLSPDQFRTDGGQVNQSKLRAAILHPYNYLPPEHWLQARFSKPGGRPAERQSANDLREPVNGEHWRVHWWNESCRMLLPVGARIDSFQSYQNGTMQFTIKKGAATPSGQGGTHAHL